MINKEQFQQYADQGFNIIPVAKDVHLDDVTPLTIYSQISNKSNTFLLESVEGGETWAQYSIVGLDCLDTIKVTGNTIETKTGDQISSFISDNPLDEIQELISGLKTPEIKDLPRFYGGYVGFFAYDSAKYAEKRIADPATKVSAPAAEARPIVSLLIPPSTSRRISFPDSSIIFLTLVILSSEL